MRTLQEEGEALLTQDLTSRLELDRVLGTSEVLL